VTDWAALAARASLASHRLIGWIFWDPAAIERRHLGEERTDDLCSLIETIGDRLVDRIDQTAGPNWMPAARERRR
jgi:hypothetical protein